MIKSSFKYKFHSKLRKDKYKTLRLYYSSGLKFNNTNYNLMFLNKNLYLLTLLFLPKISNPKKINFFNKLKNNNLRLVFKNFQSKNTFLNKTFTNYYTPKLVSYDSKLKNLIYYKNTVCLPIVNNVSFIRKHFMFKYKYIHRRTKLHKSHLIYKHTYYSDLYKIKFAGKKNILKNNFYIPLLNNSSNFTKLIYYNKLFKHFSFINNYSNLYKRVSIKNLFYKKYFYINQKNLFNFIKNRLRSKKIKFLNFRNNFKRLRLFKFMIRKLSLTNRRHFIIKFRLTFNKSYMSKFDFLNYIKSNHINKLSSSNSGGLNVSNYSSWGGFIKYNNIILSNFVSNPNFITYFVKDNLKFNTTPSITAGNVAIINNIINKKVIPSFFKNNNIIKDNKFRTNYIRYFFDLSKESLYKSYLGRWVNSTAINFLEHVSGKKVLVQLFPFVESTLSFDFKLLYLRWLPRLIYYARRLGHRFFLREALYIIHTSLHDHDSQLMISWLKAMISRISFWKTRLIFRFIRYVFLNLYQKHLKYIGAKGFKVKLKGKISIAGNGRKKTILFRSGKNSYSTVDLKVLYTYKTINTFTGVQGLQLWVFY